ncbi:Zinc transport protein ZntB [Bienertia sinuspersici]
MASVENNTNVSRCEAYDKLLGLFRKSIFGAADEVELMFVNRRNQEDMHLFGVILNQEVRKLSRQVIRVKWSLHAREEIMFELLHQVRGHAARSLLEVVRKSTREMLDEQEAVRGRLFTIQDVMQSTIRAWLQDRSLRVSHNLGVFGGCGLVLSIITGLFGINVDGIPEEQVEVRKMELQELVKMFQHEAETHAQLRQENPRQSLPPTARDHFLGDADYLVDKLVILDVRFQAANEFDEMQNSNIIGGYVNNSHVHLSLKPYKYLKL